MGAEIELLVGGARIGLITASANGTTWVPVDIAPTLGHIVTATQKSPDGTSAASPQGVAVVAVPNPLPPAVFISPLSTAMSAVQLAGLVPGANVELRNNGTVVGHAIATDTTSWVNIAPEATLAAGTPITVRQDLDSILSPAVNSLPITSLGREQVEAPGIATPVHACESSITVTSAIPSADLLIDNEGTSAVWHNVAHAYVAWGAPPFQQGKLVARQTFPRLNMTSPDTVVPVDPATPPPTPTVQDDICPQVAQIYVSGLAPGGILSLYTVTPDPKNPATLVATAIGTAGISATTETFALPPDLAPVTPAGVAVQIVASQTRCGLASGYSPAVGFAKPGGPYTTVILAGPVYVCTRVVVVQSAHIGAQLVAVSGKTGQPLGSVSK
ncbi:hypothetical protein ACIA5H_37680 [Nocardia sp. NPDC051900]|uniref:hypothetical protein n=1 Tax=Nocardia sp. NPDC051900 TaxID=3364326 RepID=UPI00379EB974